MCAGLYGMSGLGRAEAPDPRIVRSRLYACARIVSLPGARAAPCEGTVGLVEVREVGLADGIVIKCRLSGDPDAPAMVLLHALGEQASSWDQVGARFATRFRVVALDLRGHGASTWPGTYSFTLMRDDVLGVLDALALHDLVLIGHSMGGTVAYLVAQAQPRRIARLVVEDVPPPYPRQRPVPARPAGELPFDWKVVPAIVEEVNDPSLRWWKHLPDITAPTLLIGGGPTSHIPQHLLVDVSRAVPNCTLVTTSAGHDVHESHPDAYVETVLDWLDCDQGQPPAGPRPFGE